MNLISIIVPVYNIEQYLTRCIESILCQSYENFELILINDGSIDGSGYLCDYFSKKDSRIKVKHKQNEGVSAARNEGIRLASGSWITFIDGDDQVSTNYLECLLNTAIENHCNFSCCNMIFQKQNGKNMDTPLLTTTVLNNNYLLNGFFDNETIKCQFYGPVNKLFHKSILKNKRFENLNVGEDLLFIYNILIDTKKIACNSLIGYYYIKRNNSATTSFFNLKKLDYIDAVHQIINISKNVSKEVYYKSLIWGVRHIIISLRQVYRNNKEVKCISFINKEMEFLKYNNKFIRALGLKRRIDYFILKKIPIIFRFLPI